MLRMTRTLVRLTLTVGFPLFVLSGCTDEEKVFIEKPIFEDPPATAQGFLGYDEEGTKLTVCGNCHVGQQSGWENTAHADAWETLQGSGHSQELCENCHSAGPLGNPSTGDVGYAGTNSSRYHDVQCESCHGPGAAHVANPDASQPLAAITVGLDLENGCAECHQGTHHPFVEDWTQSKHAEMTESVREHVIEDPTSTSCLACHSGQGALRAWGVNAEYVEKDVPLADHAGIVCAVCHDPHDASLSGSGQLRYPIDVPDENVNLCMKCHNRRAQPDITSSTIRGPHSPEGPLLLGDAGWFPPGFEIEGTVGTHGTEANDKLCAACHVTTFQVNDQETGDFLVTVTGHRFEAIPCTDANGNPTGEEDCELADRSFVGCVSSGCHGTVDAARSAYTTGKQRIENLVEELNALLAQVPPGELANDGRFTTAEGARFNAQLGALPGTSTHNPFLAEQLLVASITVVRDQYDLPGVNGVALGLQLGQ